MKHNHYIRVKPPPKPRVQTAYQLMLKGLTQAVRVGWAGTNHHHTTHQPTNDSVHHCAR